MNYGAAGPFHMKRVCAGTLHSPTTASYSFKGSITFGQLLHQILLSKRYFAHILFEAHCDKRDETNTSLHTTGGN